MKKVTGTSVPSETTPCSATDRHAPTPHYLLPGTFFADQHRHLITTIVGSCVAVCLLDPAAHLGGMNHYLLPHWNGVGVPSPRYGDVAMPMLLERLQVIGCSPGRLTAKLFGGASLWQANENFGSIGEKNIEFACDVLAALRIPVVAMDVGGKAGRKIVFDTGTGEVLVRRHGQGSEHRNDQPRRG